MHVLFDADNRAINVHPGHSDKKSLLPPSEDTLKGYGAAYCLPVSRCSREQYESAVIRGTRELMNKFEVDRPIVEQL